MKVNPAILAWARETAGLSLDEAAHRVGLRDSREGSAADRLAALEAGDAEPSRATIVKMASAYRRPLVTFYLARPPVRADRGEDFRTLPADQRAESAASIDALVRDVRARQAEVRGLLEEEEAPRLSFIASLEVDRGAGVVASALKENIQFEVDQFRAARGPEAAFNYLRQQVERAGVFVLLIGNLGSHHSTIDPEAFRGFALADEIAPFIVINDQDAKSAWSFTLLHEFAHLLLGATGISGGKMEGQVERFCNDVASALLLSPAELRAIEIPADDLAAGRVITDFSTPRNVSRSHVAYRLHLLGRLSAARWRSITTRFREEYLQDREERRARERGQEGGPNYYVVKRHRVGGALLRLVKRTLDDGALTPTRAGKILGVKPRNVEPMVAGGAG